jgi:rhodanese-related sulfurtransferase
MSMPRRLGSVLVLAVQALKEMGFSNLKLLDILERLFTDWTAKGYPIVKGE